MTRTRLVLLSVAMVVTACAGPVPSPAPATARPSAQATSPPAPVPIVVTASVRESCGSIGGCAYFTSISGSGGTWTAELEGSASSLGSTALPAELAPGRYVLAFHSAFVSDVLSPNEQRQLGPDDAKCSRTIDIVADQPVRIEAVFGAGSCEIDTSA